MYGKASDVGFLPLTMASEDKVSLTTDKDIVITVAKAKKDAIIMHPGPMNRGIEIDTKLADDINKSVIKEQVELGVAVRMACLKIFCEK